MTVELYLLFVLASSLLVATPGPNVALVVGTSLRYGARTGLLTVGGVNLGLVLQLSAVAAGLTWMSSCSRATSISFAISARPIWRCSDCSSCSPGPRPTRRPRR